MANFITYLITKINGNYQGSDHLGNRYYEHKKMVNNRKKRWVIYHDMDEASLVPPVYHGWLHYTHDNFPKPDDVKNYQWQKQHLPNLNGTKFAHLPKGHSRNHSQRQVATGDYQAWRP